MNAADLRRGFLYFGNLDKRRPVLVVSTNIRNALASNVIVIPCTSRLSVTPTHVRLRRGEGGVLRASVLKCEEITTVPREHIRDEPLGQALDPRRIREVERAVLRAIGLPIPLDGP